MLGYPSPPVNRMTDRCKIITLPQTSFAGSNNNFDGIFSIDTLKEIKEKPTLIVCNTDPSDKAGEHWVLFFFDDNTVDFYDSLAHDITYYGSEFIYFVKRFANNFKYTVR